MSEKFFVSFFISCFLLSACVKVQDRKSSEENGVGQGPAQPSEPARNPEPTSSATSAQKAPVPRELVRIIYDEKPNSYKVQLNLPEGSLNIRRLSINSHETGRDFHVDNKNVFIDKTVIPGHNYEYAIESERQALATIKVAVPQDWVIHGAVALQPKDVLEPIERFKRIFITPESVLTTNGLPVLIRTQELISDRGTIQTWKEGQKAQPGESGRTSGAIHIEADKAVGKLTIILRGEEGGDGFNASDSQAIELPFSPTNYSTVCAGGKSTHYRGSNGSRGGNAGDILPATLVVKDLSQLEVFRTDIIGKGGRGGRGGKGPKITVADTCNGANAGCLFPPRNCSLNSLSGENGGNGNDGRAGSLCFKIQDKLVCNSTKL